MALSESSTPTKVAALAGKARPMAGPKPFQRAPTPSWAMRRLAQSKKPLYVPDGADWRRDLMV